MRGGIVGALLVLTLYGSYQFDVIGFEPTSRDEAPQVVQPVVSLGVASSKPAESFGNLPPTVTPASLPTATASPQPEQTATPEAATPTPTPEVELQALGLAEPTETPGPEPTATPEPPTSTPSPTAVPATATPLPPTVTPTFSVAVGVVITPRSGATPAPASAPAARTATTPLGANGKVTPYWDGLTGSTLGCNGYGGYNPDDATTAAISDEVTDVPCGTKLDLCNAKTCITVERKDTCPGCAANHIDVSRKAFDLLCGSVNECAVTIKKR